jgi:hypothetical protein
MLVAFYKSAITSETLGTFNQLSYSRDLMDVPSVTGNRAGRCPAREIPHSPRCPIAEEVV